MTTLKKQRVAKGLTQRDIALKIGIAENAYQRYEYGTRVPNVLMAMRIAKALGVDNVNKLWVEENKH